MKVFLNQGLVYLAIVEVLLGALVIANVGQITASNIELGGGLAHKIIQSLSVQGAVAYCSFEFLRGFAIEL